jgi:tetratricopeptide (TPR) repeat protein
MTLNFAAGDPSLRESQIVVVAGITGPERLTKSSAGSDDSLLPWGPVVVEASHMHSSGRATWLSLPPLDRETIDRWIGPVSPDLAALLMELSGGEDLLAGNIWTSWIKHSFVVEAGDEWVLDSRNKEPVSVGLLAVLLARVSADKVWVAEKTLEYAAWWGDSFSVDAVVKCAAQATGLTGEEIADLLDDLTQHEGHPWLLKPAGEPETRLSEGELIYRWRYSFDSSLVAAILRARSASYGLSMLRDLYAAGKSIHSDGRAFASDLARLALASGSVEDAIRWRRLAATTVQIKVLETSARALLAITDASAADLFLGEQLTERCVELAREGLFSLAVRVGKTAVECAPVGSPDWFRWKSAHSLAAALMPAREFDECRRYLLQALEVERRRVAAGGGEPTPNLLTTLSNLGALELATGDLEMAAPRLEEVEACLGTFDEPDGSEGRDFLASSKQILGRLAIDQGHFEDAAVQLQKAQKIQLELIDEEAYSRRFENLAITLHALGRLEIEKGDFASANLSLGEALGLERRLYQLHQSPARRGRMAISLNQIGKLAIHEGQLEVAAAWLEEALEHLRHLYDREPRAYRRQVLISLSRLGRVALDQREFSEASTLFAEAQVHARFSYLEDASPDHRRNLAIILSQSARLAEAIGQREQALDLFAEALDHQRELYRRFPTPHHRRNLEMTLSGLRRE